MALTSSSEKPLAIRPITVEGSCPDLNASIAVTMSAGLRPLSRGTVVSAARVAAWQPEQERAPGAACAETATVVSTLGLAGARLAMEDHLAKASAALDRAGCGALLGRYVGELFARRKAAA